MHGARTMEEEIPPSDSEEEEAIRAEQTGYWEAASSVLGANRAFLLPATRPLEGKQASPPGVHLASGMTHNDGSSSPPRKKMRLSRSTENISLQRRLFTTYLRDVQSSPVQLPSPKSSTSPPSKILHATSRLGLRQSLAIISNNAQTAQNLPTPSPALSSTDLPSTPTHIPCSSSAEDFMTDLEEFTPHRSSHVETLEVASSDPEESELEIHRSPPSLDEHLFTPPKSQETLNTSDLRSSNSFTQNNRELTHLILSPLTPIPSPRRASPPPSPSHCYSHSAQNATSPHPSVQVHGAVAELNMSETIQQLQTESEHQAGRYRLRERQARQIKPYFYDAKLYERQLRGNPEAIVHIKLSGGRHRASSPETADSSDREVDPSQFEPEDSDGERPRARRSKSAASEGASRIPNTIDSSPPRDTEVEWRPAAFDVVYSSDEDDPFLVPTRKPREPPPPRQTEVLHTYRAKRFPMSQRSLQKQKSHSPSIHDKASPAPRSFSRTISHRRIESSDEEAMSPTESHRKGNSRSPPPYVEQDVWEDLTVDDNLSAEDHPPTSPRVSSSSMDGYIFGDDDFMDSDPNLSPRIIRDVRESAGHWPHGNPVEADGISRFNPIEISDDEGHDEEPDESSTADTESDSEPDPRHPAGMKTLRLMYPPAWIAKQLNSPAKSKTIVRRRMNDTDEGPVQPGHVRVRRRAIPVNDADIKGDSDSSDEMSVHEDQPSLDLFFRPVPRKSSSPVVPRRSFSSPVSVVDSYHEVLVDDYSSSNSESDDDDDVYDAINDEARAKWNEEGVSIKGDKSLIDYMLNRTGIKKRTKKGSHGQSARRQGIRQPRTSARGTHVVTHGVRTGGRELQTHLDFARARSGDSRGTHDAGQPSHASGPSTSPYRQPGQETQTQFIYDVTIVPQTSKQKDRRKNGNLVGLYTFSGSGKRITTGRSYPQAHTTQAVGERPVPRLTSDNSEHSLGSPAPQEVSRRRKSKIFHAPLDASSTIHNHFSSANSPRRHSRSLTPAVGLPRKEPLAWPTGDEQLDCNIAKLRAGFLLPNLDRLRELIAPSIRSDSPTAPPSTYFRQASLEPSMPIASFIDTVATALSTLVQSLCCEGAEVSSGEYEDWRRSLNNTGPYLTWFHSRNSLGHLHALDTFLTDVLARIYNLVEKHHALRSDDGYVNLLVLELQWYAIETAFRIRRGQPFDLMAQDPTSVAAHLVLLVDHMLVCDSPEPSVAALSSPDGSKLHQRLAELWICLIHVTQNWEQLRGVGSLWDILLKAFTKSSVGRCSKTWYIASERVWTAIFSLCAWSQFSRFGLTTFKLHLPSSWKLVDFALSLVNLTDQRDGLSSRQRKRFDGYIRLLIGRCMHLYETWLWDLQDVFIVLKQFLDMFKARHFSNLLGEKADYPKFLRVNNLELLREQKGNAYTLFLKFMVAAAENANPAQVKKLLSVIGPVGGVSFGQASSYRMYCSMYNRLTFIAVAIYLDPDNAKNLIAKARRYVDLKGMDHMVCRGCLRGAMYIGMVLRKKDRPLQDVIDWLTDITEELITQFVDRGYPAKIGAGLGEQGDKLLVSIQMALGCVSRIITAEPWKSSWYPDPALLAEQCIARICLIDHVTESKTTVHEIQNLIMTYLDVRNKSLPSRLTVAAQNEESQEDYGPATIDFDDPDLLAALDDDSDSQRRQERDKEVVNRISVLGPICERMICRGVQQQDPRAPSKAIPVFRWVDCWIACASVVVRSGQKNWGFYLQVAEMWWKDIDPLLRLKLRLRFRFTALRYDPSAYESDKIEFLRVMLQCMAVPDMTIAHDYVALVLWNDGLRHPILQDIPCELAKGRERFELSKDEFTAQRASILERIMENISESLKMEAEGDRSLSIDNEKYISLLCSMLTIMKYTLPNFNDPEHGEYLECCRRIYQVLSQSPVEQYPTLRTLVTWLHGILPSTTV